jgi:serine/threonine protein kinase
MTDAARKIGKYDIVSELGRGAMGVVYKGLDPAINRYVANKTVTRTGADENNAEMARRFKQEAVAAARLNHPGIVAVYEYGEDADQAFIAIEFVTGKRSTNLPRVAMCLSPRKSGRWWSRCWTA